MCCSPIVIPETGVTVACRKCRLCIENRIKDWVGRCMAEVRTAAVTYSVTLTYGSVDGRENHEAAAILTYSHVQNMFKKLRRDGYPLRYLVAGEYGSKKGRAHWHGMLFFKDKAPPEIVLDKRVNYDWWPHGFAFVEKPHVNAIQYVCKYINKDQTDAKSQGKLTMSKVPVLGGLYFAQLARQYAEAGQAPRSPFYTFPEARLRNGKRVQFYLSRAAAGHYAKAFLDAWHELHPNRPIPSSDFIEEYQDRNWWALYPHLRPTKDEPDDEALARAEFIANHNEHYFGKTMAGVYHPFFWLAEEQLRKDGYTEWLTQEIEGGALSGPPVVEKDLIWTPLRGWHRKPPTA